MKFSITILLLLIAFGPKAQEPEHLAPYKTYWQSFGFQKQPDFAKIAYYKSDSLGYEPVMAEVISFNKDGKLIQKYTRIFGKYAVVLYCQQWKFAFQSGGLCYISHTAFCLGVNFK